MRFAYPKQTFQDWLTQQWVIFRGKKINPTTYAWLMGPFGNLDVIGEDYINHLAEKENLIIDKHSTDQGLIPSMKELQLSEKDFLAVSKNVIDFYEKTSSYDLNFSVKWNPFFKIFGMLINTLFSNRINQLNIPTKNLNNAEPINSEIITLVDPITGLIKYTFWYRSVKSTGQVIYSGVYGINTLPSGEKCIKAIFPLPNGNATVFLSPKVGANGELILDSSGKNFGDAGFYFLLKDAKGEYWSQYIRSFRDKLIIKNEDAQLSAVQTLTLWHLPVLRFNYTIQVKKESVKRQALSH